MRISMFYMCFGLICVSSVAGCGVISRWTDSDCSECKRPSPRMVARKDMQTQTVITESKGRPGQATESIPAPKQLPEPDRLPAIPGLPMPQGSTGIEIKDVADVNETGVFKVEALPEEPRKSMQTPGDPMAVDTAGGEKTVALKSVQIDYGHTEGFKSVTGQVQMWKRVVRLRYAPVDQEDPYGGFVILEGGPEVTRLRDGQHIRIRGVLIQPEGNGSAHYRVQSLEVLD
jgi:hypothetical protein